MLFHANLVGHPLNGIFWTYDSYDESTSQDTEPKTFGGETSTGWWFKHPLPKISWSKWDNQHPMFKKTVCSPVIDKTVNDSKG